MTFWEAFTLGVVQGATEFLPVSSSGHLVVAHKLLPSGAAEGQLLFDLVVHLGTLGAIVVILRARVAQLVRAGRSYLPRSSPAEVRTEDRRWIWLIAIGSVPTALIGLFLRPVVEAVHSFPSYVGLAWIGTAVILVLSERIGRRRRGAEELGVRDALIIGSVQGLAVIPGLSRSGFTVAAALLRDAEPETAVEFSMLLSIPAILGANVFEFARTGSSAVAAELGPLAVGFVTAFAVGAAALKLLQWAVSQRMLSVFALYCVVAAIGVAFIG